MINTLEEALQYISQLESENKALREEVERYRSIKPAGRKKHDKTWMASYNNFVVKYEKGMSIMEIVSNSEAVARRTGRHAGWLHGGQYEAYQADKLAKGSEVQKANVTLMRKLNG